MTDSSSLLSAAYSAQAAHLHARESGVRGEALEALQRERDRTAEAVNAWGRAQQAKALPTVRSRQELSDDDLSYEDLIREQERSYRESV